MSELSPQPLGIPVPRPSLFSAPYWEGCRQRELRITRCRACATPMADAPRLCRRCHGADLAWEVASGRGSLYSWTVVWRPQTPAFRVPYAPAIVELEEGVHLLSAVIGCDVEDLREGLALTVEFHPCSDDQLLAYFRPATD